MINYFLTILLSVLIYFGIRTSNIIWEMICNDDEFSVIKSCLIFLNSLNPDIPSIEHNQIVLDILNDIQHRYTISPNQ